MLADLAKRLGRRAGLEISRYRPYAARRARRLHEEKIETVIDVGANTGQYGAGLRKAGFEGRIVSLEPLSAAFAALAKRTAEDPAWECLNVAAGPRSAEAVLNVASNSASSSLLAMRPEHRLGAPTVTYIGEERVEVRPLDALELGVFPPALLKLDVQGYEAEVFAGAEQTLAQVRLIECELALTQLYERQPRFEEMVALLGSLGFEMCDLDPFFYDVRDGRVLALDALFARTI